MKIAVKILPVALEDIAEIHAFILDREGPLQAGAVLDGLEKAVLGLGELSARGHSLPELVGLGFRDILEIHFKPYRIIYKVFPKEVPVFVVADGRRSLQALLERRTLR